jgi:hypothetical protein
MKGKLFLPKQASCLAMNCFSISFGISCANALARIETTLGYDQEDTWEIKSVMNILFYARDGAAKGLQETIEKLSLDMEIYRDVMGLMERLRHPLDDPAIAVLVADSTEGLKELLLLRYLLRNVRIILVLPDRESATVSKGHDMQARFLTFIDNDPAEVALVLSKMVEKAKAPAHQRSTAQACRHATEL